jgi:glutamate--cysteine ligase
VNLDPGPRERLAERWALANTLGPTLSAIFANSPLVGGMPSGWRSTRLATWLSIDPTRTVAPPDGDPEQTWAQYVLDAHVMLVRRSHDDYVALEPGFPFARWVAEGHELGYPTEDDLRYHITTLFPPVRPHGWLELRSIDALPEPWWRVAVAVTAALIYDDEAAERARRATLDTAGLWREAARHGLGHPALEGAAQHCFAAVLDALPRVGADPSTFDAVLHFYERYVARGRCPADDPLDAWARDPNLPISQSVMDAWS